jgi:hypothetical protein
VHNGARRIFYFWAGLLSFLIEINIAHAAPFVVIVSKQSSINELSADELVEIFMDRSMGTGKSYQLYPIDSKEADLKADFYRATAKLSLNSVHAYWSKRVFSGRGRPPLSMSEVEIADMLKTRLESIAYVKPENVPAYGKIVFKGE